MQINQPDSHHLSDTQNWEKSTGEVALRDNVESAG